MSANGTVGAVKIVELRRFPVTSMRGEVETGADSRHRTSLRSQ
jgi:hypothetical protein